MKSKILALALFAVTAAVVTFFPSVQTVGAITPSQIQPVAIDQPSISPLTNERPRVEVVFVLDTTGSMGGLIQAAKEKIWSIATNLASAQPAPEIRMGLVAYRDRGDRYITQVVDLSTDLDSLYAKLMDFQAQGGGDGPESVNQALFDAVHKISWSQDTNAYQTVFLVGDAPPHMDYQNDVKYPQILTAARRQSCDAHYRDELALSRQQPRFEHAFSRGSGSRCPRRRRGGRRRLPRPPSSSVKAANSPSQEEKSPHHQRQKPPRKVEPPMQPPHPREEERRRAEVDELQRMMSNVENTMVFLGSNDVDVDDDDDDNY